MLEQININGAFPTGVYLIQIYNYWLLVEHIIYNWTSGSVISVGGLTQIYSKHVPNPNIEFHSFYNHPPTKISDLQKRPQLGFSFMHLQVLLAHGVAPEIVSLSKRLCKVNKLRPS
jgi:hypothetical protein